MNPEPTAHLHKKRGGQLKSWMTKLKDDWARLNGPEFFGHRRWNWDWMTIRIAWAQHLRAWTAAVLDAVLALDAGATAPR